MAVQRGANRRALTSEPLDVKRLLGELAERYDMEKALRRPKVLLG